MIKIITKVITMWDDEVKKSARKVKIREHFLQNGHETLSITRPGQPREPSKRKPALERGIGVGELWEQKPGYQKNYVSW